MRKRFELGCLWRLAPLMAVIFGALAWLGPLSAQADTASPWLGNQPPVLQELSDTRPIERPNYNLDCTPDTGTTPQQTISGCATYTSYGVFNSGYLRLHNTSRYGMLYETVVPIPNNTAVLRYYDGTPTLGGVYIIPNYPSHLRLHEAGDNQIQYNLAAYEPVYLRDKQGKLLNIDYRSITFSKNGDWMLAIADEVLVRVNLRTFEVMLFDEPYYLGSQVLAQPAITNNGRYAVIAATRANRFRLYDLSACETELDASTGRRGCAYKDLLAELPPQLGNDLDYLELRFLSDYTLSFYRREQFEAKIKWTRYTLVAAGQQQVHFDYLALGDSFASGEGAYEYKASSAGCHISKNSYPYLIRASRGLNTAESVACAGAVINDIASSSPSYAGQIKDGLRRDERRPDSILTAFSPGYLAQKEFVDEYLPSVITVSVGGNDIGFGRKLLRCIEADTCYSSYEDRLEIMREMNNKFPRLVQLYRELLETSTGSRVYVLGYPHLFQSDGDCGVNVRLNAQEVTFSNLAIDYLNSVLRRAAEKAGAGFVDLSDAFDGHRLCQTNSSNTAVNGLTAGHDAFDLGLFRGPFGGESYHPNALGQQLLKTAILAQTNNFTLPMPPAQPYTTQPDEDDGQALLQAPRSSRPIYSINYDDDLTNNVIDRQGWWGLTVDGAKTFFKPLSTIRAVLNSEPVQLGSFSVDKQGGLVAKIQLPSTVPVGFHSLHLYGENLAGEPIDVYKIVFVAANNDSILAAKRQALPRQSSASKNIPATKTVPPPPTKQAVLSAAWSRRPKRLWWLLIPVFGGWLVIGLWLWRLFRARKRRYKLKL